MALPRLIFLLFMFQFSAVKAEPVPEMFLNVSQFCDVPARLLYAVAKTESNRKIEGEGFRPWPWTLNIDGGSYFYDNREDQYDALMDAIKNKSIVDIGLMQLNWRWKHEYLSSAWMATDPLYNVTVACRIIRDHYDGKAEKDWFMAAGLYHREAFTEKAIDGRQLYINRVRKHWDSL